MDRCERCGGDARNQRICPLCRRVAHPELKVVGKREQPPSSNDGGQNPSKHPRLDEIDAAMMAYIILTPKITNVKLARLIGFDPKEIGRRRNKPLFQFHVQKRILDLSKPARKILEDLQPRAALKLGSHMESKTEAISLRAAEDILRPLLGAEQAATITVELQQLIQFWTTHK